MARKSKSKTSVNVDAVRREAAKIVKDSKNKSSLPGDLARSHAELAPGSVRRESPTEQEMGTTKYHKMIHDHNDKNKHILDRLPFTFPKKRIVRSNQSIVVECVECGHQHVGSENTVGFCCPKCEQYRQVTNPEAEKRGYDPEFRPGIFATSSDILEMKEKRDKKKSQ